MKGKKSQRGAQEAATEKIFSTMTMSLSDIVEDGDMYPRGRVDPYTVRRYAQALRAGAVLPPLVVAKGSRILVDGYHRARAHAIVGGPDAKAPVEVVEYANRGEMMRDSWRRNSTHGRPFDARDRARIVLLAKRARIPIADVATALGLDPGWLANRAARRTATAPDGSEIALKRTLAHLAGERLTPEQSACNEGSGGMPLSWFADHVRRHIEADAVDWESNSTVAALRNLREALAPLDLGDAILDSDDVYQGRGVV